MKYFELKLVCVNCGYIGDYTIPKMKVFEDYTPLVDIEGLPLREETWSGYRAPTKEKMTLVFCNNCGVPMLIKAPVAFSVPMEYPPIANVPK